MSDPEKITGIHRYLKPKLFPVYGILLGWVVMWIIRWTTGIIPYQYPMFYLKTHGVTIADLLILGGLILGLIGWWLSEKVLH